MKKKLNRIDKAICKRVFTKPLPTAYDGWDRADVNANATAFTTKPNDYMKRGGVIIFYEQEEK